MADIPGIRPIGIVIQIACLAMARSAKGTDLDCCQLLGVLYGLRASGLGVSAPRTMTRFAVNARLARLNLERGRQRQRSGRVTAETTQRRFRGVECLVHRIRISRNDLE